MTAVHDRSRIERQELVGRTVREALEAIASPAVADRILHRALQKAQLRSLPPGSEDLQRFVDRHLSRAIAFMIDVDAAHAVTQQLAPLIERAIPTEESGVFEEIDPRNPKVPKQPPVRLKAPRTISDPAELTEFTNATVVPTQGAIPFVLIASLDPARQYELEERLDGDAVVQTVEDIVALLEAFDITADYSPVVVIDCMEPAVQPSTLATVAPDLPHGSTILLWGANRETEDVIDNLVKDASRWIRCGVDATADDVCAIVSVLID